MIERAASWTGALAARFRARIDPGRPRADEIFASPLDGGALHVRRLSGPRTGRPVVLCHGLGGNSRSFDLPGCLGNHLSAAGFDVFLLDLTAATLCGWQRGAAIALQRVLEVRAAGDVAWVGHSLGGWVGLTAPFAASPRDVFCLGTSLFFEHNEALGRILRVAKRLGALTGGRVVPQATLGAIEAPLMGHFAMPTWLSWVSPPGLRGPLVRQLHALGLTDIPRPMVDELLGLVLGRERGIAARDAAMRSTAEVTLFAGADDPWAPIERVRRTKDLLDARPCRPTELVCLDVGHAELLFGADREALVFEPIERRLLEGAQRDPSASMPLRQEHVMGSR